MIKTSNLKFYNRITGFHWCYWVPEAKQVIQTGLDRTRQQGCISHEGHQIMTCRDGRCEERVKCVTYSNRSILIWVTIT